MNLEGGGSLAPPDFEAFHSWFCLLAWNSDSEVSLGIKISAFHAGLDGKL